MTLASVLVIEDDRRYRDLVLLNLVQSGYQVRLAATGLDGLNELERSELDLVILDLVLPDMDGFELCSRIRAYSDVPIVMLTAKAGEVHKVRGLRLGADDYITKPFGALEFLARVEAVLRRCQRWRDTAEPHFSDGELIIEFARHRVTVRGRDVDMTPQEYKLLYHLAMNAGRVLVHDELLRRVWGPGYQNQPELLHTTIRRVRAKIEDNPSMPRRLRTRRGIGYYLEVLSTS